MSAIVLGAIVLLGLIPAAAVGLTLGPRQHVVVGKGHEVHVSAPAVAVLPRGGTVVAWVAQEGDANNVYVVLPGSERVRLNPEGLSVDSLHQSPSLAVGPGGEIYVAWSSRKPVRVGGLFASDLRLSRSLDGGRTFEPPLRVNEDRPISHSFEGLAVAADGTVLLSWIDTREGERNPRSWLARVVDHGSRVDGVVRLDDAETCVCCRIDVAAGPQDTVAVLWRKVFPGDVRDMVLGLSHDGGRTFRPAGLVHPDRWQITACPHRGGNVAIDGRGRIYAAWYTEGRDNQPAMLFAVAEDGRRFGRPQRLDVAAGTIPDHVRLAGDARGRVVMVWEDMTAARRRVLVRYSVDGGRTLAPVALPSSALKAYGPDVAVSAGGDFVLAWHEEQFPDLKLVVQPITLPPR